MLKGEGAWCSGALLYTDEIAPTGDVFAAAVQCQTKCLSDPACHFYGVRNVSAQDALTPYCKFWGAGGCSADKVSAEVGHSLYEKLTGEGTAALTYAVSAHGKVLSDAQSEVFEGISLAGCARKAEEEVVGYFAYTSLLSSPGTCRVRTCAT